MMHGSWYNDGWCSWFGGYGWNGWHLLLLAGFVALIFGLVLLIRNRNINKNPLELLKIQFVEGKITEEEYVNRKNVITRS